MARGPRANFEKEVGDSVRAPTPRSDKRANPPKRMTEAQDEASDKAAGIPEGSARDLALDKQRGLPPDPRAGGASPGGMPPDAHHVAAAASIAHAILGSRGGA